jgi:hypothetical protein
MILVWEGRRRLKGRRECMMGRERGWLLLVVLKGELQRRFQERLWEVGQWDACQE